MFHHEEAHSAADVPEGRRRHAGAAAARRHGSGAHRAGADRRRAPEAALRRHLLPARHGAGHWEPRRRRAAGQAALHPRVAQEGEGPDGRHERPVVEVGRAARGHDRIGPLGGRGVSDRHQAAEDGRLGRDRRQRDDRPDHRAEDRPGDAAAVAAAGRRGSELELEQLRRGLQLLVYTNSISWIELPTPAGRARAAHQPAADGAEPAGRLRAPVRQRLDAGTARASG